jgi:hypothetical protein
MSLENMIVVVVELCMVILGSLMLYTHTKNRWLLALFVLLSIGTAIIGWSLGETARRSLPIIMIYTIVAVEYSMVQMDRRIDALLKTGVKTTKPPYKLILLIAVMLSAVISALVTSPPSAMQSHIELIVAIVLIAVALVSRIIRILLRGYQVTPKENP